VGKADKAIWAVIAGQGRQEACGLALDALTLIIWEQLKSLSLSFGDTLGVFQPKSYTELNRVAENSHFSHSEPYIKLKSMLRVGAWGIKFHRAHLSSVKSRLSKRGN
jgi:hypothetical protein